jgi:hypothetical protein
VEPVLLKKFFNVGFEEIHVVERTPLGLDDLSRYPLRCRFSGLLETGNPVRASSGAGLLDYHRRPKTATNDNCLKEGNHHADYGVEHQGIALCQLQLRLRLSMPFQRPSNRWHMPRGCSMADRRGLQRRRPLVYHPVRRLT